MSHLRALRGVSGTISLNLHLIRCSRPFSAAAARMTSVSSAIMKDHREIESYYNTITKSTDPDERTRFQNLFTWELARYCISEELVVYPALEKYVKDGQSLATKDRDQHQKVKEKLKAFQDMRESDSDFDATIHSLMAVFSEHVREEEEHDLVQLEDALTKGESEDLAKQLERTKMFIPSRSHPMAPAEPPFETAVGLMMAPIDRLGDMFRKFPSSNISHIASNPKPQVTSEK